MTARTPRPGFGFHLNPLIELHWRDWGEDSVALEACTGRLYQFDPLSAAVMACIEGGSRHEDEVLQLLASDLGTDTGPDATWVGAVHGIIGRFVELGWLEHGVRRDTA